MKLIKKVSEYKIAIIRRFFDDPSNLNSRQIYNFLKTTMEKHPSRASVINYMNELCEDGYMKFIEKTGKGGYHRIYFLDMSNDEFTDKIYKDTQEQLDQLIKQMRRN